MFEVEEEGDDEFNGDCLVTLLQYLQYPTESSYKTKLTLCCDPVDMWRVESVTDAQVKL